MSSNNVAIQVNNLNKSFRIYKNEFQRLIQFFIPTKKKLYDEYIALSNINFIVKKGETVAILGKNGAGKSTLLQLICSTLTPTSGTIKKNGKIAALLELGAGFNSDFTGRENIYISAAIYGLTRNEIDEKISSIIAFADIGDFIDQPVKTYSSGMFVRLAFALIAHVDADILIVDEALAVGDVFFQQKCMRFLRGFQEKGGTILFVSHDTSAVLALCQRAILLKKTQSGETEVIEGNASVVCNSYLEEIYKDPNRTNSNVKISEITQNQFESKKELLGEMGNPSQYYLSEFTKNNDNFFGKGGGSIEYVHFIDEKHNKINVLYAEQKIGIQIQIKADDFIKDPAIGVILKDNKGQFVFTESSDPHFREENKSLNAGSVSKITFFFEMPTLIRGHYSFDFAFANGIGDDHYQIQWIHDAITLECITGRQVHGILGFNHLTINWHI